MKAIILALAVSFQMPAVFAQSPVAEAIHAGNLLELQSLLDEGAPANDALAVVAVVESTLRSRFVMVDQLLFHGLDLNRSFETDNGLATPLTLSILKENTQMAKFLVNRDADINQKDEAGRTPLCTAQAMNNVVLVSFFTEIGATPTECK